MDDVHPMGYTLCQHQQLGRLAGSCVGGGNRRRNYFRADDLRLVAEGNRLGVGFMEYRQADVVRPVRRRMRREWERGNDDKR